MSGLVGAIGIPYLAQPLQIKSGDSPSVDAFGRWRVSTPETLFDSKLNNDAQPLFWDDQQISGASTTSTYNTNQSSNTIAVGASTAGHRVRQTFRRFGYQPGKSQLILLTGIIGTGGSGITKRIGYFDDKNGLFFEQSGTTLRVGRRTYTSGSAVDTTIDQSSWNIDKLDGTGTSGINIDVTKTQIIIIDFEWLGVGRVRFGFVVNGIIYYCHELLNANNLTLVYMSTPNLPIRYEIINDGSGGANSLVQICCSVQSEGGQSPTGRIASADRTTAVNIGAGTTYPVVSFRKKSAYLDVPITTLNISALCTGTANFRWELRFNPTLTGASFADITNSACQSDVAATVISGGTTGYVGYSSNSQDSVQIDVTDALRIGSTIAGVSDILTLAITNLAASPQSFHGCIVWREQV
jgi:hypothetical protein